MTKDARFGKSWLSGLVAAGLAVALLAPPSSTNVAFAAPDNDFVPEVDYTFRDHTVDAGARIDQIMSLLTLEEKVALTAGSAAIPRLGINSARGGGGEGLHGATGVGYTVFPQPLGMSQSWDPKLYYDYGEALARESTANGGGISRLTPVLDLTRDPRYGRAYETMGEDAYLTGELGTQATLGMNQRSAEGYQLFLPNLKHPLAYNNEINRLWTNSVIPDQVTNEYYIKAFKYPISAGGAKSLMNSYPLINGKPMSVNPLQRDLLGEWTPDYPTTGHYEYVTVNDYGSGSSMWAHSQRYFEDTPNGWALGSGEGTQNGQMGWSFREFGNASNQVYEALRRGMLSEADVTETARRRITYAYMVGDLDQLELQSPHFAHIATPLAPQIAAHKDDALLSAQEQIVLLKNDGALPLAGASTTKAVLLGSMTEDVFKNHYTGTSPYIVSFKDAMQNKLGAANIVYDRAVDTVAIKASNGKYLKAANNTTWRTPGGSNAADTPVQATGEPANGTAVSATDAADKGLLFDIYDYGELDQQIRTPINDRFLQVPNSATGGHRWSLINNTNSAGERNLGGGSTYSVFQTFRLAPTPDGKYGIYQPLAGNGGNNSFSATAMAYDVDDEDLNNGTYLRLVTAAGANQNWVAADVTDQSKIGPWRAENHVDGPDIATAPFDNDPTDRVVDALPTDYKFGIESVRSAEQAIAAAVAAAPANAPIILTTGMDSWLTAREAVDLQKTGLSDQQKRQIDYITNTLGRDVIVIVKTSSPMAIDSAVQNNPKVKAILEISHSAQEEGPALVTALFDNGYSVPATGWVPTVGKYTPYSTYTEYPGYIEADRTLPAYSPAGRLSATWYANISDMVGASEDHPAASYRWPDYDEDANDNLSNMNGTIPTGILTYDIVKGERTYQYFNGTPLYSFGYGLTYTTFAYSNVAATAISNGKFTVSGTVRNTGARKSDEVVQIYSSFTGAPSRIVQPNTKLIAFDRIRDIEPGQSRSFSFEIDLVDKLGVWDVEAEDYIVEPGAYSIRAAKSSTDPGTAVVLNVTNANGGRAAATRNVNKQVLADKFDDYSNLSGDVTDIELVSSSVDLYSNTALQFREPGAWVNFKNVSVPAGTNRLSMRVRSDRAADLKVYALPVGANPSALAGATALTTFGLDDSRPIAGIPTGLGIGPISVISTTRPQTGSPAGQNTLDNKGEPYKNAYIKPDWSTVNRSVSLPAGSYDLYVVSEEPGTQVEWFKFAAGAADTTASVAISNEYSQTSIREKNGSIKLRADLTPVTSTSPVQWQVLDEDGSNTNLATLSQTGVLRARGVGNGTVVVTAYSNGHSAQQEILITNQLDSNKVTITGAQKTIDFVSLRTGAAWGGNDNIQRYQGTSQQTAVSSEIFAETTGNYHQSTTLLTVPTNAFNWTVTNEAGQPTTLATVNATGLVTATGAGDGKVVVVATLINNPDIVAKRTITVQNQGTKNAVKMIQAENYDIGTGTAATTWATGGNQMGLQVPIAANATLTFKNVDFANTNPGLVAARLAPNANASVNASIEVWVDAGSVAAGGRRIGTIASATTAATNQYATYTAVVSGPVSGIHDVILRSSAAIRLNWFTFAQYDSTNLAVLAAMVNTHQSLYANQAYYTPASWTAFDTAWRAGKALVDAGSTSDVAINAAITALTAGVTGLVELVDTTLLQALVNQARSILASPGEYVSSTLTGLQAAYDAASPLVAPDATPTQAAVDAASLTLATAVQRALLKGDTTVLNALITFVGTLNPNDYTATTWAAVTTAVNQGRTVAGLPEPSKLAVDDAVAAINAALTNLLAQAVKTGLNSAIRVAQGVVDNIGAYTPSTVVGFADALNAAKAVYNDANATQAQVNAAQSALMTRILDAKLRPATSPLSSALTTAAGISLNGYSADSVAKLTAAVAAGRNLLANPEATQAAVNQQAAAIKAALKGLKTAGSTAKALKTAKPKIAGKAVVGKKVKVSKGAWTSGSTFTYRWYANGQAIAKATKASYKVKAADAGKKITVKVTAKKAGYAKAARSSKAVKVKK